MLLARRGAEGARTPCWHGLEAKDPLLIDSGASLYGVARPLGVHPSAVRRALISAAG